MEIENNTEFEALCARLLPKFNEYLARRSKNIFSCELATTLDGINSMPALYDSGGTRKQVIAPLSLLSQGADEAAESANAAADRANTAAASMETAVSNAETAAKNANDAADKANTAATNANTETTIAKGYNEHPTVIGDNGNWWNWNGTAYVDTGKPSRAVTVYPTFYHRGNKLYIEDVNETMSTKMKRKGNKLVFSMVG